MSKLREGFLESQDKIFSIDPDILKILKKVHKTVEVSVDNAKVHLVRCSDETLTEQNIKTISKLSFKKHGFTGMYVLQSGGKLYYNYTFI